MITILQVRNEFAHIEEEEVVVVVVETEENEFLDRLSGFPEANRDRAIKLNSLSIGIGSGASNEI